MKNFIIIIITISLSSCADFDSNLFNPKTDIEAYLLDDYEGDLTFRLDDSYKIDDELIDIFTLTSTDENETVDIYAIYIGDQSRIGTDTVIMYCHGNSTHMDIYWERAKLLANVGGKNRYGVLMIDYRGYGLSEGTPTESGLYADVDAGLQWLKEKGLTDDRLIIYGFSLGSVPSTHLTATPRSMTPSKLILEAPIGNIDVMLEDGGGLSMPSSFMAGLDANNIERIKSVEQPFLWIHGEADNFLSVETHGQPIYNNYNGSYKIAYRIPGGDHSDVPLIMGFEEYSAAMLEFILR